MTQLSFDLDPRKLARSRDPSTSHQAADRVKEFAAGQHATILHALRQCGPMTAHEIADKTGLQAHAVGKRLGELGECCAIRLVWKQGEPLTRKTPSGRSARVWQAIE